MLRPRVLGRYYASWNFFADFFLSFSSNRILRMRRLFGGYATFFGLRSDTSLVPSILSEQFSPELDLRRGNLFDAGPMAGGTTSGGSSYPGFPVPTPQHFQYYHNGNHNGLSEPPPTDRSDAYIAKFDGATGAVAMGTFYGGRGGVPVNWTNYSQDGDMVTSLRTRHSRLFLTGATTSYWWFPVNALDGTSTSFLQYTPPANQIAGATDITHGFIAQLSWLNAPVGIQEVRPTEVSLIHAWFLADGSLVLDLPAGGVATSTLVEVFDAQGKLVFSDRALPGMTRVQLATGGLASGLYLGRLQGTHYRFKAMRH